jgi:5'-3' exonuclease
MIPSFPKRGYKRRNVERLLLDGLSQRSDLEEGAASRTKNVESNLLDSTRCIQPYKDVILPTFVEQGANIISCDTAEADDLAAGLARCAIRSSAKEAIIITGDSDFAQLVTGPVKVHDISKACLLEKQRLFDPKVALLRKNSFWRQVG